MADKKIEQMLEHLVNDDVTKAEELFHEYVVAKSREIYESLIDSEIEEAAEEEEEEDLDEAAAEDAEDEEDLDESSDSEDDEEMDENFDEVAIEGDDEEGMGADAGDDALGDMEMGDEEGEGEERSEEELFQDLDAIVDELQSKFDELKGMEAGEHGEEEMGGEEPKMDAFEPEMATVREYVEKVPAGHGAEKKGAAEKADNTKSLIDNMKNDMGGTTANILSSKEDAATFAGQGALKGNGVLKGKAQDMNTGNINVPGGKAGNAFSKKEPGHGAEKKGAAEQADNKQSLFRGRR
jgi:hypothetical protein